MEFISRFSEQLLSSLLRLKEAEGMIMNNFDIALVQAGVDTNSAQVALTVWLATAVANTIHLTERRSKFEKRATSDIIKHKEVITSNPLVMKGVGATAEFVEDQRLTPCGCTEHWGSFIEGCEHASECMS